MMVNTEVQRRNRRLALALAGLFALLFAGSVSYIDWVGAGTARSAEREKR